MSGWSVFLGPSLKVASARALFEAEYLPPIRRGDLVSRWEHGARRFAIIDGEFGQALSVSLTEIREVLRQGGVVCGASSMGALRAVEAAPLGMIGKGWVHEQFAAGVLDSDDEVALTFDADSGRALTLPLVNVRWALDVLVGEGALSATTAAGLLAVAQALPYTERSWQRVLGACPPELSGPMRAVSERVRREPRAFDRKRLDAEELLSWLAEGGHAIESRRAPEVSAPAFVPDAAPAREVWLSSADATRKAPGIHRQLAPEEALERAVRGARTAGVSRLADVTRLDTLGVHVWSSIRPHAEEHDNTVTGGKGFSREAALLAACAEAIERSCMTPRGRSWWRAPLAEARARGALDPRELVLNLDASWTGDETLHWWPARDVISGALVHVPASTVFFPFTEGPRLHSQCSTGLAAGASLAEALLYGLFEIIERHATTRFEFVRRARPVRLESCLESAPIAAALEALRRSAITAHVWLLESEIDVPTFRVVLDDVERRAPRFLNGGYGAHLHPAEALKQALLEASFARSTVIAGAREDIAGPVAELEALGYEEARRAVLHTRGDAEPLAWTSLPNRSTEAIASDLAVVVERLRAAGCDRVLATDLSRDDVPFRVVRALVPGLAFAATGKRVSARVIEAIRRYGLVAYASPG